MVVEQDPISLQQAVIVGTSLLEEHGDQLNQWKAKELRMARRQMKGIPPDCVAAIGFADRLSGSVPFPFSVAKALEWLYAVDKGEMLYLYLNLKRGMGYYQLHRFTKHGERALVEAGRGKTLQDLLVLRLQGLNHSF